MKESENVAVRLTGDRLEYIDRIVEEWRESSGLKATRSDVVRSAIDMLITSRIQSLLDDDNEQIQAIGRVWMERFKGKVLP